MDKPDAGDELGTYEHEIDAVVAHAKSGALSSDDCSTACRALESMRRATDRICSIEVGAVCEDARRRTATAENKVIEACPSCAAPIARASESKAPAPASEVGTESVPPPHGGCAGCAASPEAPSAAFAYAALVVGVLAWRRARRRTSPRAFRRAP